MPFDGYYSAGGVSDGYEPDAHPPRLSNGRGRAHLDDLVLEAKEDHRPQDSLDEPAPVQALPPLVLVEGFFSFFHEVLWGPIEKHLNASRHSQGRSERRRILFARVGPVSSMHDRACELYAVIKGGRVDYGEEHSQRNKHDRFGRFYERGLYASWSRDHPVHFLAHSLGGNTVVKLQALIAQGHFGPDAHPDMISSVSTVSAPFHGTSFAYLLGKRLDDPGRTRFFSMDMFIQKWVHYFSFFKPITPSWVPLPDWHGDARKLTFTQLSPFHWFRQLFHRSDWGESLDVISYDATFHGARASNEEWNKGPHPSPNTFYRSYVACMTERETMDKPFHVASWRSPFLSSIFLYQVCGTVGKFDYRQIAPLPHFYNDRPKSMPTTLATVPYPPRLGHGYGNGSVDDKDLDALTGDLKEIDTVEFELPQDAETQEAMKERTRSIPYVELDEDHYANDGVVPLFSQWHPGNCSPSHCLHHSTLRYQPHSTSFNFGRPERPPAYSLSSTRTYPTTSSSSRSREHLKPGIWNVCHVPDSTHVSFLPLWHESHRQKELWVELGEYLEEVDAHQDERISMPGMLRERSNDRYEHVNARDVRSGLDRVSVIA